MLKFVVSLTIIGACSLSYAQDWGPYQPIEIGQPIYPGNFNPSYCEQDSTLYFDTYCRHVYFWHFRDARIYTSRMTFSNNGQRYWTTPTLMAAPINIEGYGSTMPFINGGGDTLLFCSDRPGTRGNSDIWMSIKSNGVWQTPTNLGDSINTSSEEFKPSLAAGSNSLFFDRVGSGDNRAIYKSEFVNGVWQAAVRMPDVINIQGHYDYSAFYDPSELSLYFTDYIYSRRINLLMKSRYENGAWQRAVALPNNINRFEWPDTMSACINENSFITESGNLLFFDKYIFGGTDYFSQLFLSEKTATSTDEIKLPRTLSSIESYPNPFNSQTIIKFSLAREENIKLDIYDILGRKMVTLLDRKMSSGSHEVIWNAGNFSSGVYFALLATGEKKEITRLVLLK